ncbi:DUF86 domain-containing protein [Radiobacillus kanasensis]|uniref:type VII toxin-antitoxin system HepT family RNase toxin n=1 Tax=Radiobacillus kanasensis TaxID=2844358 RepID=UPI001E370360|nr:DUF86 domain-containing protein [Radiobacillus kanasensis]UFT99155.1 DUF86 domain-containing protein [Radiobacillus kanasensis]
MVDQDIWINKVKIIERCLKRIQEEYEGQSDNLLNYTKQDSIILNLQRCCEAAIDLAMHFCRSKDLGIPQSSRESFDFLVKDGQLSLQIANNMKSMIGFRNIAVHDYQRLNIDILETILKERLSDFQHFVSELRKGI